MRPVVAARVTHAVEEIEKAATEMVAALVESSGVDPALEWMVGSLQLRARLPSDDVWEDAHVRAYRDASGQPTSDDARAVRVRRFVLSRCVTQLGHVEFDPRDEGDDALKLMILSKLPEMMVERMWLGFLAQRNALLIVLATGGEAAVKKSPATPDGAPDGGSSGPRDGSPSTGSESPS